MNIDISKNAEKAYRAGVFMEAARLYQEAANEAIKLDDPLRAAELKNNSSVAFLQAADAASALNAAMDTDKTFAQAGDIKRQAMALGNQASALEALGRLKEALLAYQTASDLLKSINETELRSYVLKNLSSIQLRTGNQLEALATMQAALDTQKKLSVRQRLLKKLLDIPFKMWR